jgi:general stress protein CsbA
MIKSKNEKKIDNIIKKYFYYFSRKDILNLDLIFNKNITLKDWTTTIKGKNNVLSFNRKIFNKFKKIKIKIILICYNRKKKVYSCKIIIYLDKIKLKVIDLLYFDKNHKIKKIEAYKI